MNESLQNTLYGQLNAYIIKLMDGNIRLNYAGFIIDNCSILWLPILLNCVKNINIFNAEQTSNVINIINNLRYGNVN